MTIHANRLINRHPDSFDTFSIDLLTINLLRQINRPINKHPDAFDTFSIDLTIKHAKANQSTD